MAVPDTTTFTLQDVVTEVNPTTDDLVDCFADAVSGSFDSSYSGSKNQLLNFRNYGAVTLKVVYLTVTVSKPAFGCSASLVTTNQYHNGTGNFAVVNDTVYTDSGGSTTKAAGRYGQSNVTGFYYIGTVITVDSSGVVTAVYNCGP